MPIATVGLQEHAGHSGAPAARQERRQKGRARVSREMLIRSADFNGGSFEEICSTVNFSRGGFYFLTLHDRYRVGMRLRVSQATQSGTEDNWEHLGRVVRVHRQGSGFGVAVFLSPQEASRVEAAPASANSSERRATARTTFVASTEIIDAHTGERVRVRTADLSTRGCYIDTLNPLPVASTVRLQIEKDNQTVGFRAKVVSSHIGSGMGLVFEGMTAEQRSMLAKWLGGEFSASSAGAVAFPIRQESGENEAQLAEDPRFLRLLNILLSKGILSEAEAHSLLCDL